MWHAWEIIEKCTCFWWESLKKRDHSKDRGVDGRKVSEYILGRLPGVVWSGFNWLMIGSGGGCCKYGDKPACSGATEIFS
jgi:hypothetical protein